MFAPPSLQDQIARVRVTRPVPGRAGADSDWVAREEPLEIQVHGAPLAVVMRTPGHDEELGLGFLLTERIVDAPGDVVSVRHCSLASTPEAADNVIQAVLRPGLVIDLESLRRNLYASSSCGICGKATLERALASAPPLADDARFARSFFPGLVEQLRATQSAFERTGGLHAAGLFAPDGRLLVAREDVGRHNAVDKVIGHAAGAGLLPLTGHVLLVSGRISFEIVQKALAVRIPVVAAVSAPTSLAVQLAEAAGITLVGFLRGSELNAYGARGRIVTTLPRDGATWRGAGMDEVTDPSTQDGAAPIRARLRVRGRVQGVWFRGWTRDQALRLGLVGFARNLPDGSVEVVAQGSEDRVRQLLDACRQGPSSAFVEELTHAEEPAASDLTGFRVL